MFNWRTVMLVAIASGAAIPLAYSQKAAAPAAAEPTAPKVVRPGLFLKEEWKQTAKGGEHAANADSISNPNLELKLYVPSGEVAVTGSAGDENNPTHVWLGTCTSPCAVALRDKTHLADLTGLARVQWNTKMSGFHQIRPIVKLSDGTWLVGDEAQGSTHDWLVSEVAYSGVRWMKLDIARVVTTGLLLDKVDLSNVDEIGFADLMPGSGHGPGGWSDVAQIQVFAKPIAR